MVTAAREHCCVPWQSVHMRGLNKVHIVQGSGGGIGAMLCEHCALFETK